MSFLYKDTSCACATSQGALKKIFLTVSKALNLPGADTGGGRQYHREQYRYCLFRYIINVHMETLSYVGIKSILL